VSFKTHERVSLFMIKGNAHQPVNKSQQITTGLTVQEISILSKTKLKS